MTSRITDRIVEDTNGCWIWQGAKRKSKFNYGWVSFRRTQMNAHRMSWILFRGEIPNGMFVLHKCDVPPCVNPDHLFLGSHADNMQDMWNKLRHPKPKPPCKLSHEDVAVIRTMLGKIPQSRIASMFGVVQSTIAMISTGKNWRANCL